MPDKDSVRRIVCVCLSLSLSVYLLVRVAGYLLAQPEFSIAMAGGSVLLGVGAYLGLAPSKQRRQEELVSEEGLDRVFRRTHVNYLHVLHYLGAAVRAEA